MEKRIWVGGIFSNRQKRKEEGLNPRIHCGLSHGIAMPKEIDIFLSDGGGGCRSLRECVDKSLHHQNWTKAVEQINKVKKYNWPYGGPHFTK